MSGMGFGLGMHLRTAQVQFLAPRMIQSMEILQMAAMALHEKVEAELQENPFLETPDNRPDEAEVVAPVDEFNPDAPLKQDESGETEFARLEEMNRDWEDHFNEEHRPSRMSLEEQSDKKLDAMMNIAQAPRSLQDHLTDQLAYLELTPPAVRPGRVRHQPPGRQRLPPRARPGAAQAGPDRPG